MINFNELDRATYETLRQTFIELLEAKRVSVYDDGIGIPTIGIGYNVRDSLVAESVISSMGVGVTNPEHAFDFGGNPVASAIESNYVDQLRAACANNELSVAQLTDVLNQIMANRHSDAGLDAIYGVGANNERKQTFTYTGVNDPVMLDPFNVGVRRYEDRVNGWAAAGVIPDSYERLAFLSMAYRGDVNTGVAPSMRRAFDNGNRAELWYEIRYNTVGSRTAENIQRGVAKRKYIESEMIGLFSTNLPLMESEAIDALKMYSRHRNHILDYDADERRGGSARDLANEDEDFTPFLMGGSISDIHGELNPAINWIKKYGYDELKGDYLNLIQHLDGEFIFGDHTNGVIDDALGALSDSAHPLDKSDLIMGLTGNDYILSQKGNDVIFGGLGNDEILAGEGHDQLFGGEGNDTLTGGEGADKLSGGTGKDTYIFDGNFGRDIVIDGDGSGTIVINGITLNKFEQVEGTDIVYRDNKRNPQFEIIKINEGSTTSLLIIPLGALTNSGSVIVKNWSEGQLGLQLSSPAAEAPDMTGIITLNGNSSDNSISYANYMEANPNYKLAEYKGLLVNGNAGHDLIMGFLQGNDTLLGGDGDDVISGGFTTNIGGDQLLPLLENTGKDSIDGGKGDDFIVVSVQGSVAHGGDDNDALSAGYAMYTTTFNVAEFSGVHTGLTRDQVWSDIRGFMDFEIKSEYVNDVHNSSIRMGIFNDISSDYKEHVGATSGKKFILNAVNGTYSFTYNYGVADGVFAPTGFSQPLYHHFAPINPAPGHDLAEFANVKGANLYGDKGEDTLAGGIYSDYLSGGDDADVLMGDAGHDILDGGEGADKIFGDEGNDTILGGAGNDTLVGSYISLREGALDDDIIYGGDGDDVLEGGSAIIFICGDVSNSVQKIKNSYSHLMNDNFYTMKKVA